MYTLGIRLVWVDWFNYSCGMLCAVKLSHSYSHTAIWQSLWQRR